MSYLHDYKYRPIGYTDELEENYISFLKNSTGTEPEKTNKATEEFENFLIRKYVISCVANAKINGKKDTYLNIGKEFLVGSLVSVISAFVPFLVNYFYHIK